VQLPDVVEEVLCEGVACSISFNRHGTILAGAAVQITGEQSDAPFRDGHGTHVQQDLDLLTVLSPCNCSWMPGWQDRPVGFPDAKCGQDPRGAQVH
jgi:hypothetical protein